MVYVKDKNGKLFTLQEVAQHFNVSLALVQGRYRYGVREIEELIKPKWAKWDEGEK